MQDMDKSILRDIRKLRSIGNTIGK